MKLAIMQPYFFPYIGYFQLIHAVDQFVLFDDVQYIRHGWVNRNRILKPDGGWQYILAPLKKHAKTELIKNVIVHPDREWKQLIVAQLGHYKKRARYFNECNEIVKEVLFSNDEHVISEINFLAIKKLCRLLDIKTDIIVSSKQRFDYSGVDDAGEWALRISEQMGASEYVNPIAGVDLFSEDKFAVSKVGLSFLKSNEVIYSQFGDFTPSLSIIDVLMFNGVEGTKDFLNNYSIGTSVV